MTDFYSCYYRAYRDETVGLDPEPFLGAFARQLSPGDHVLDVGCGSGRDLLWLRQKGMTVTGFERSPGLAKLARKHAGCEIVEGDFRTYDFTSLAVDAILMTGALVHVPHNLLPNVLKNILHALDSGSRRRIVYISMKEGRGNATDNRARIFYFWQKADLVHLLSACGMEVLKFQRGLSADGNGHIWLGFVLHHRGAR